MSIITNTADSRYFGYGSNLNQKDLRKWKKEHEWDEKKSFVDSSNTFDGIFFLLDYQLQFPVKSPSRNAGVLDVTPKLGHAVVGKLFEVENWDLLDAKEGAPNFYKKIPITVIDENGNSYQLECDYFFSTMPVKELVNMIRPEPPDEVLRIGNGLIYRDFFSVIKISIN